MSRRSPARLQKYRQKRDFFLTREPAGTASRPRGGKARQFVVQKHAARRLHYDLRLEHDGVFKSWALPRGPSLDPSQKRLAVEVEDHPLEYGSFEGTIPAGQYGGGTVQIWDRGTWVPSARDVSHALAEGRLSFELHGKRLRGGWALVRMRDSGSRARRNQWLFIKQRDMEARPGEAYELLKAHSMVAGRTLAQIAAGDEASAAQPRRRAAAKHRPRQGAAREQRAFAARAAPTSTAPRATTSGTSPGSIPDFVPLQLCTLVDAPPDGEAWVHEPKLDGYRMQLRVVHGTVTFTTRSGADWTHRLEALAQAAKALPDCMLDGELVALDAHSIPQFSELQAALSNDASKLVFFVFDLLFSVQGDERARPLLERKEKLERMFEKISIPNIRYLQHFHAAADAVLSSACRMELEGIISKRADAPYTAGRSMNWTKAKCRTGQEVVLGGWIAEGKEVRSLLAGVYRDQQLQYIGRIGTGFGRETSRTLMSRFARLERRNSPFSTTVRVPGSKSVHWLKPSLVAEVRFAGWTADGLLRQAAFKGLRSDKSAADVVRETGVAATAEATRVLGLTITHPDKPLWPAMRGGSPAVTKGALARYLEVVGEWMLPHVSGRPLSVVRAPNGITQPTFFQRHMEGAFSALLERVPDEKGRDYVQISRVEGLIALAQMGVVELHPWNNAPGNLEVADRLVFDLDPGPGIRFEQVVEAALALRVRLSQLGLVPFCKTTGGKGLHVVVPLTSKGAAAADWTVTKTFAHTVCALLAEAEPSRYVINMAKAQRRGRIFLDYLRNARAATAVAPLSPRARPGAPVSMPLNWDEVDSKLDPSRFTLLTAAEQLRERQPWADYAQAARSLPAAAQKLIEPGDNASRGSRSAGARGSRSSGGSRRGASSRGSRTSRGKSSSRGARNSSAVP